MKCCQMQRKERHMTDMVYKGSKRELVEEVRSVTVILSVSSPECGMTFFCICKTDLFHLLMTQVCCCIEVLYKNKITTADLSLQIFLLFICLFPTFCISVTPPTMCFISSCRCLLLMYIQTGCMLILANIGNCFFSFV